MTYRHERLRRVDPDRERADLLDELRREDVRRLLDHREELYRSLIAERFGDVVPSTVQDDPPPTGEHDEQHRPHP